jgi:ankyrin repeat protein
MLMNKVAKAIANDSIAALKSLVRSGIDLKRPLLIGEEYDLEEYDEISPLFYAIRSNASLELIRFMLKEGIDLYWTDQEGISALDMAVKFKRKDMIQLCMEYEFDLNVTKRKSGMTPVMLAACFSDTELMQVLLDHGGDLNLQDQTGMTPLDYARKLGQKKMQLFLEEKGARYALYAT